MRVKSRKVYKYIFWFKFDCCIVNAFTLVRHFCPITDSSCQILLAFQLIGEYSSRQRYSLPAPIRYAASHIRVILYSSIISLTEKARSSSTDSINQFYTPVCKFILPQFLYSPPYFDPLLSAVVCLSSCQKSIILTPKETTNAVIRDHSVHAQWSVKSSKKNH